MSNPMIALMLTGGINLVLLGVAWGSMRQQIKAMPSTINGTTIRPHEGRCNNYSPHRQDQTNPNMRAGI